VKDCKKNGRRETTAEGTPRGDKKDWKKLDFGNQKNVLVSVHTESKSSRFFFSDLFLPLEKTDESLNYMNKIVKYLPR
jgi:hypothetical protein